jgi:hypothetical protein
MLGKQFKLFFAVGFLCACFDPLYESGAALNQSYVICCSAGMLDSCLCSDERSCKVAVYACANGCSSSPSCFVTSDAGVATGGGNASGGGSAGTGGGPNGGGAATGGGFAQDAGTFDAGNPFDAGVDAGVFDAGIFDAGSPDSGVADAGMEPTSYEFCCTNGRLATCVCRISQCGNQQFTTCANARCAPGLNSVCM